MGDIELVFDPGNYNYLATELVDDEDVPLTRILPETASLPTSDITTMRRPVYYEPAVKRMRYHPGYYLIYYDTGDEQAILQEATQDYFFAVEDREEEGAHCNWVRVFDPGEKCLSAPSLFNDAVYFSTFRPEDICGGGYSFYLRTYHVDADPFWRYWYPDPTIWKTIACRPEKIELADRAVALKDWYPARKSLTAQLSLLALKAQPTGEPGVPPDRLLIDGISDMVHFWQEIK